MGSGRKFNKMTTGPSLMMRIFGVLFWLILVAGGATAFYYIFVIGWWEY
jgi:hypothetical protein